MTIGFPIGNIVIMKIDWKKTIRPTQLQPKLYATLKELAQEEDYMVIIGKNNTPLCILASYSLLKNIDFFILKRNKKKLIKLMQDYYSNMSLDEQELINEGIDDGYAD